MRNDHKLGQVELDEGLSGSHYRDGVLVVVRCYRVREGRGSGALSRLEVLMEGHGHQAAFDLPARDADLADDLIDEALHAFTATIRLRDGSGCAGSARPK